MDRTIVGVDLGGTQIRVVLAKADGELLSRQRMQTRPEEGVQAVIDRIIHGVRAVIAQGSSPPQGIGIGSPGPLDPHNGIILAAPNLGWENVPLKDILEERLSLPVVVGNDANAAALAEWQFGAGMGARDLVYMTISTGIGGGIVSGGRLLLGRDGMAGEIGHTSVEACGRRCKCGNVGCVEAYASGPAIAAQAVEAIRGGRVSRITSFVHDDLDGITPKVVARAARTGDTLARELLESAAFYIGVALVNVIHTLAPEIILLGGGVAESGDLPLDTIRKTVQERTIACMAKNVRIERAALGGDAGVLGAVATFLQYGHD